MIFLHVYVNNLMILEIHLLVITYYYKYAAISMYLPIKVFDFKLVALKDKMK